jgi:tetrahydromethanopterin S-methyltransferase subunit G
MTTLTFDTHDFVKKLKGVGFSEEQAEVLTDLQKATSQNTLEQARHDYELDDLATKRDLKEVELKIEMVKSELKREIADTKADLIKWVVGVVVGVALLQTTIIAGLIFRLADKV